MMLQKNLSTAGLEHVHEADSRDAAVTCFSVGDDDDDDGTMVVVMSNYKKCRHI